MEKTHKEATGKGYNGKNQALQKIWHMKKELSELQEQDLEQSGFGVFRPKRQIQTLCSRNIFDVSKTE